MKKALHYFSKHTVKKSIISALIIFFPALVFKAFTTSSFILNNTQTWQPTIAYASSVSITIAASILATGVLLSFLKNEHALITNNKERSKRIEGIKYCFWVWGYVSLAVFLYGNVYLEIFVNKTAPFDIMTILAMLGESIAVGFQFFLFSIGLFYLYKKLS